MWFDFLINFLGELLDIVICLLESRILKRFTK